MRRRERIEPTDDWDQLVMLFEWPGQREYEELRPLVLFGSSVAERSRETGTPERTLYRKVERFEDEGPRGLFSAELANGLQELFGFAMVRRWVVFFEPVEEFLGIHLDEADVAQSLVDVAMPAVTFHPLEVFADLFSELLVQPMVSFDSW